MNSSLPLTHLIESSYNMAFPYFNSTVYVHANVLNTIAGQPDKIFNARYAAALLPLAKVNLCSENLSKCGTIFAKYATYELPKMLAEGSFWIAAQGKNLFVNTLPSPTLVAKTISDTTQNIRHYTPSVVTDTLWNANAKISELFNVTISEIIEPRMQRIHNTQLPRIFFDKALDKVKNFPQTTTKWIIEGKSSNITDVNADNINSFTSSDLVGPIIMQMVCLERTTHHFSQAVNHIVSLKNFNDVNVKFYLFENIDNSIVTRYTTDLHSRRHLVLNAFVETLFAGAWGTLTYFSHEQIYDIIKKASGSPEKAFLIANAILIGGLVGPKIFGWACEKFKEKPKVLAKGEGYPTHMIPKPELVGLFPLENVVIDSDLPAKQLKNEPKSAELDPVDL